MTTGPDPILSTVAIYLAAGVVAVTVFKRLGLGSILGFLVAGALIGPSMLGLIPEAEEVRHIAEFGVVLLLFVIGLELQPSRLWRMRGEIFGLGSAQVGLTGAVIGLALWAFGFTLAGAVTTGLALALSSTAFGVQIMRERGEFGSPYGRRAFAILLFQDVAVVPLLALAAFLAPLRGAEDASVDVLASIAVIVTLIVFGRYGLPWLFRLLAVTRADEVFTAAALLVVAASALATQSTGMSMAIGAFLAGVMLAETEFRHQLETDIEPFRALFLGLFFISVGMSVDWGLATERWATVAFGALALFGLKAAILFTLSRWRGSTRRDSARIAATLGQSGEFAFVLLAIEASTGLIALPDAAVLTATVGVSMALTPLAVKLAERWVAMREAREQARDLPTPDQAKGPGRVIVAGFGRTGQVIARILRLRGYDLTLIDNSPRRIQIARGFGDQVLFGDGSRLDVLTMAGAAEAKAIFLCINDREGAQNAVSRLRERFPDRVIVAMTYDRFSLIEMRAAGVHEVVRETFESGIELARRGLISMGDAVELEETIAEFRRRDEELIRLQIEYGAHEAVAKMREKYEIAKGK